MKKNEILLSICIPTYNRCDVLVKTLETYVNDPAFDSSVEIVISDNCSTDNTQNLVLPYIEKYKNISYKRLEKNIGADLNYNVVLSMGKGLYLKLMNDSVTFKKGALKSVLIALENNKYDPIFFYGNIDNLNSNTNLLFSDINQMVANISYWITWIANFGVWRNEFEVLENKDRLAHLQFVQVDWTLRIVNSNKKSKFIFDDFYEIANLNTKGGYNLFQTFGVNYLSIYKEYINSKLIKKKVYNKEKYRLFRYFIMHWYQILLLSDNKLYTFEKDNCYKILMNNYKCNLYFYIGIFYLKIKAQYMQLKINRKNKKMNSE